MAVRLFFEKRMKFNIRFASVSAGLALVHCVWTAAAVAQGTSPYATSADFAKYAMRLRESAILQLEPRVQIPTSATRGIVGGSYPWKMNIVTTVFWAGESATVNNPVHNFSSSWDKYWATNFGGFDNPNPTARRGYIPAAFIPRLNPFYVALPYNDVSQGHHKAEASRVIPWFRKEFVRDGQSVCRDRWIAVRNPRNGKVCYGQWSDCGPFRTDHWQYVFGSERPKWNLNKGAALDVSPAIRDYLGIGGTDITDWKFIEFRDIPRGPWSLYGENNHFVLETRRKGGQMAKAEMPKPQPSKSVVMEEPLPQRGDSEGPTVLMRQ